MLSAALPADSLPAVQGNGPVRSKRVSVAIILR
jgi:hypothetical protein